MIESSVCRVILFIYPHKVHALAHAQGKSSLASTEKVSGDIKNEELTVDFVRTKAACQRPTDDTASWEIKA